MNHTKITKDGQEYYLVPVPNNGKPYVLEKSFKFEVYPEDAPKLMTYVDAVKWVEGLEGGWRIPTKIELVLIYEQKDTIGGFKTGKSSGSICPQWYWSCTEHREDPSDVLDVRFSDGDESWHHKDYCRLSCRPVRLVAASAPTPAPG